MTDKEFLKNLCLLFGAYSVGFLILGGAVIGIPILLFF